MAPNLVHLGQSATVTPPKEITEEAAWVPSVQSMIPPTPQIMAKVDSLELQEEVLLAQMTNPSLKTPERAERIGCFMPMSHHLRVHLEAGTQQCNLTQ